MDPSHSFIIVTGAHLHAEAHDRPWAYWLRDRLREAAGEQAAIFVCCDLWYLNNDELRGLPTVSVGGPEVNALSAYLASRLPSVVAVEGKWVVLMEPEGGPPVACCWGKSAQETGAAVEAFAQRHLAAFLAGV